MHELAHINNICQLVLDFQKHPKKHSRYNREKFRLLNEPDIHVFFVFVFFFFCGFNKSSLYLTNIPC